MADSKDDPKPPPEEPARTVFMPSTPPAGGSGGELTRPPGPDSAAEDAWFSGEETDPVPPYTPEPLAPPPHAGGWGDGPAQAEAPWSPPPFAPPPPRNEPPPSAGGGRIAVGMVLNHIYEVRRFIARGGMGEVYEGVNVNTDERVAIKVILSHLAMDPNVVSMFRKEARTLTRLSHPALVQYRVLAQEPTLGVLYIVTEFIDGAQLADQIGKIRPNAEELEGLTRRLASGLAAAHELGAIHRDMAPDNVLLPDGRLDQATIIDFGIAKDLDPSNKTIVGEGFAGKLGFVAPEQFGDYNREVGPWTDVYSLALVILAVANGRPVDMGSTLVEAIDRRRAGPDLSPIPDRLRPVFAGMLKPNPAERFRSMTEVLQALDRAAGARSEPSRATAQPPSRPAARKTGSPLPIFVGIGVAVLVMIGAVVFFATRQPAAVKSAAASGAAAPVSASTPAVRSSEQVRQAVEAALPGVTCSWIDINDVSDGQGGVQMRLSGVAGSPADAQRAISNAAGATGAQIGVIDASSVFPISQQACGELDAFRRYREPSSEHGRRFVSEQSTWQLMSANDPCVGPNAKAVVDIHIGDPAKDFSIIGMDAAGGLQQIFANRSAFKGYHQEFPAFSTVSGDDSFSSTSCYNETGLVGELLVVGARPFDLGLPDAMKTNQSRPVDQAWLQKFAGMADARGWKTSMVWYRVVKDQGGG